MTREIAIQSARSFCYEDRIARFINKIYDAFESRTCENCMHYIADPMTMGSSMICERLGHGVALDFGCNKFSPKEII